jgi:hypothetical protein
MCLQNRFGLIYSLLRSLPCPGFQTIVSRWFLCYMISCIFDDSPCPVSCPCPRVRNHFPLLAQHLQQESIFPADPAMKIISTIRGESQICGSAPSFLPSRASSRLSTDRANLDQLATDA